METQEAQKARRVIRWIITLAACGVALVHVYFPDLQVDAVTVALLTLAAIPWLAPLFRSIELPGGFKVEYQQELEAAAKKAEASGLVAAPTSTADDVKRKQYSFETVAHEDPNLALAGLRIEVESRLRDLARSRSISATNGIRRVTRQLFEQGVLKKSETSAIEDLLPLLNRAAHGEVVDDRTANWALRFGPRLLGALEERIGEPSIEALMKQWRDRDGAAFAEVGTALSKAFVRSPQALLRAMSQDEESFSGWLGGMSKHTFTMFESQDVLDDRLYEAYYGELQQMMEDAARSLIEHPELGRAAQRVLDTLEGIEVRSTV